MLGRVDDRDPKEIESARVSAGQRRVNILWEHVQAAIALSVVGTSLVVSSFIVVNSPPEQRVGSAAFLFLACASFLVMGFYFGRTNHTRTGGVGDVALTTEVSGR